MRLRLDDQVPDRWTPWEGEGLAQRSSAVLADERSRYDISSPKAAAAFATAEPGGAPAASPSPGAVDVFNARDRLLRDDNVGPL